MWVMPGILQADFEFNKALTTIDDARFIVAKGNPTAAVFFELLDC